MTVELNVTTKDRHYLVVKVNYSDVHYHIVVKVNTYLFYSHIDAVTITEYSSDFLVTVTTNK